MAIRLLHFADLHLDRAFLQLGGKARDRRRDQRDALEGLVDLALREGVQAVLITGDLFDGTGAPSGPWVRLQLERLVTRGVHVLLIPGNHDEAPECHFYTGAFPAGLHVFAGQDFTTYTGLDGVTFYGLPFHACDKTRRVLSGFRRPETSGFHVGLVHGQFRLMQEVAEDYCPIEPADVESCGLDYLALGHYHSLLDCSRGRTKAFYPGSPVRLDFAEAGPRHALLVELTDTGVSVTPIPLRDRRFIELSQFIAEADTLYAQLTEVADPGAAVRVRLTGLAEDGALAVVEDLMEKFSDRFFAFVVKDETVLDIPASTRDCTVAGEFRRRMKERIVAAATEEERELLGLAYEYGVLALKGGRLE